MNNFSNEFFHKDYHLSFSFLLKYFLSILTEDFLFFLFAELGHFHGHLGRFIELLTYKSKMLGKRVIVIDERDTTKTCAIYGHIKERMVSLSERIYQCEVCGIVRDRDKNTAINIMKRFLSHNALWTDYQYFLSRIDNLRYTVNGKTKVPPHLVDDGFSELVGGHLF